jgi:hypothetical protein
MPDGRARASARSRGAVRVHTVAALLLTLGCSEPSARQAPSSSAAGRIDAASIDAVCAATGLSREAAVAALVEDVLLAEHLRASDGMRARELTRVALARSLLGELQREALAQGPPTDAEIHELSQRRWWELARPPMMRVIHAVVLSEGVNPAAEALARRIASAVAAAPNARAFRSAAQAVPADGFTVKVEELPPVTADGRSVDPEHPPPNGPPPSQFDLDFARAAAGLNGVGSKSPVVRSKFGYHVLQLTGSIPALEPSVEERRTMLHDEILVSRARAFEQRVLEKQRSLLAPQIERAALELTGQLEGLVR